MHAACLSGTGPRCLFSGPQVRAKAHLSQLLAAGMGFAADDLTLVHCGGLVQGVPFAPTVKRGAWALAQKLGYKLDDETFRRLDGKNVKYIVPERIWTAPLPIRSAVILDRHASNPTALNRIDEISALKTALSEAFELIDVIGFRIRFADFRIKLRGLLHTLLRRCRRGGRAPRPYLPMSQPSIAVAELARSPEGIDWHALTSAMPDQLARDCLESLAHRTSRDVRCRGPRVSTLGPVFTTMAACSPHLSGAPPCHQCTLAGRRLSDLALSARSCRTDTPRRCCRADLRALQEARSGAGANVASRGRAGRGPKA